MAAVLAFTAAGCDKTEKENAGGYDTSRILQAELPADGEEIAVITTSKGVVKMRFYPDEAPKAVENFKTLAKDGYYDGLLFHRVIDGFMVQTGDPTGTGSGGESCWGEDFEDEISGKLHFYRGAVAMANSGPNTNGSQFFIVQAKEAEESVLSGLQAEIDSLEEDQGITLIDGHYTFRQWFSEAVMEYYREHGGTPHLETRHTIFGQVFEGMDTVDAIAAAETGENDKPVEDVIIEKIEFEPYQAQ
ncbi:MAG: peptidylprolyl isomerase [Anaerotignum sp.]|nr:peptidylprolyl isomerase [Anaerotignum sp.]